MAGGPRWARRASGRGSARALALELLHRPVLLADSLDQLELGLAPVQIALRVLAVLIEEVIRGVIGAGRLGDLGQPRKPLARDLQIVLDALDGIGDDS